MKSMQTCSLEEFGVYAKGCYPTICESQSEISYFVPSPWSGKDTIWHLSIQQHWIHVAKPTNARCLLIDAQLTNTDPAAIWIVYALL